MKPNPRRLDLSIYPHRFQVATRFSDVDPQWHLNNVRLMEYYQEARMLFLDALKKEFDIGRVEGARTLVAHMSVDYLDEVRYPGAVTLGVGVLRIGTTSYSLGLGLFQNDSCAGISVTVLVHANQSGAAPLPEAWREVLQRNLLPEAAR
jgi:acyl-CoA thioester hydrolase